MWLMQCSLKPFSKDFHPIITALPSWASVLRDILWAHVVMGPEPAPVWFPDHVDAPALNFCYSAKLCILGFSLKCKQTSPKTPIRLWVEVGAPTAVFVFPGSEQLEGSVPIHHRPVAANLAEAKQFYLGGPNRWHQHEHLTVKIWITCALTCQRFRAQNASRLCGYLGRV